ncbi:MAG: FG-GAP repeat protein, partial [Candidatus Omnitrophica bacterium]|nr:FG-GAP repeat protein [Candidatus Omnitrophota bacterium]
VIHTLVSPNETTNGDFGSAVGSLPDVNSDGVDDIVVGALGESLLQGKSYIFDGASGALLRTLNSPTPITGGQFGFSVSGVPDTNGDGRGDVVVGAYKEDPGDSPYDAGRVHLFDGSTGELIFSLQSPDEGIASGARWFGYVIRGSDDINGDGRGETLVGEIYGGPGTSGQVHIFSGSNGDLLYTLVSPNEEPDGSAAFAIPVVDDLNGDGAPDLVVGAPNENPTPSIGGRAYIYHSPFPSVDMSPTTLDFPDQDPIDGPTSSLVATITNTATDTLQITEVEIVGTDADQFTITGDSGEASIGVGLSRTVDVAFDPSSLGDKKAKLRFVSHSFVWQTDLVGVSAETPLAVENWNLY